MALANKGDLTASPGGIDAKAVSNHGAGAVQRTVNTDAGGEFTDALKGFRPRITDFLSTQFERSLCPPGMTVDCQYTGPGSGR
jgi:hypothetical protein